MTSEAAARRIGDELLRRIVLPARAFEVSDAPTADAAGQVPVSPYLVQTTRWWTIHTDPGLVELWFQHHPPRGMASAGSGALSSPGKWFPYYIFSPANPSSDFMHVLVSVTPMTPNDAAIGGVAQVIWTPPRPREEYVPMTVQTAHVRNTRGALPGSSRTVTGARVRQLAAIVNELSRDTRGVHGCSADDGSRSEIVFDEPAIIVTINAFCASVGFRRAGRDEPALILEQPLADLVREILRS